MNLSEVNTNNLTDIKSLYYNELVDRFKEENIPAFRAKQVYGWLVKGVSSFDEMNNIPKDLKNILLQKYYISCAEIEKKLVSEYDGTVKYLFKMVDGDYVESVLMKYKHGYSICISTQVGCKMGCSFCATGLGGFIRNLTASEMLSQIQTAQKDNGIRISNIVLMGMGEPLDNYNNVIRFLNLVSSEDNLNIGMRHISLSTCGLVDKIKELEKLRLQLTLSVSLHAPNDKIRDTVMPVNKRFGTEELLGACRHYAGVTSRRISFEYIMLKGINDTDECAKELAQKLKGMLCHVNLIPANDVKEKGYVKSGDERIKRFVQILSDKGISVTVRRTLGSDINASCGQLRSHRIKEE